MLSENDIIVALATAPGVGAISVIRVSGNGSITLVGKVFKGTDLDKAKTHTIHFGTLNDGDRIVDEVLVSVFRKPHSFTKEDGVEISCHGSPYVVKEVIKLLINQGARLAKPGEFTKRAFLNGRFDLAQAEAVADLIYSDTEASHQTAMNQMRGGFSEEIRSLRAELINFASLVELELDFSEEDVEFADRSQLKELVTKLLKVVNSLMKSFDLGNVIKNGVPTVIAGKPNAGKSTLLNTLLQEEKAIVSHIPGTTRDFIEDEINIGGINFRFIDTAGLRETTDTIEKLGVERTKQQMEKASLIIYLFDLSSDKSENIRSDIERLENSHIPFIKVGNKVDKADKALLKELKSDKDMVFISASNEDNIDQLKDKILELINLKSFRIGDTVVTNLRHYESLLQTKEALDRVVSGIDTNITPDLLAEDIRQGLHYLGEITGEITTEDLLENIFSKFCIGK